MQININIMGNPIYTFMVNHSINLRQKNDISTFITISMFIFICCLLASSVETHTFHPCHYLFEFKIIYKN